MLISKNKIGYYADLVREISSSTGAERGSKCGYDILKGLEAGDADNRARAWKRYLLEKKSGVEEFSEDLRDGVWVPAVYYKLKLGLMECFCRLIRCKRNKR